MCHTHKIRCCKTPTVPGRPVSNCNNRGVYWLTVSRVLFLQFTLMCFSWHDTPTTRTIWLQWRCIYYNRRVLLKSFALFIYNFDIITHFRMHLDFVTMRCFFQFGGISCPGLIDLTGFEWHVYSICLQIR